MGLIVPWLVFVADVILFLAIGYAIVFLIRRLNKYGDPQLNAFIKWSLVFLVIGEIGRITDLIDDFCCASSFDTLQYVTYFISIVGIIYSVIHYIKLVEMKYLPAVKKVPKLKSSFKAHIVFSKNRLLDVIDVLKEGDFPVLVITRSPDFYSGLNRENVSAIWVTQSGKGVAPTALHVLQGIILDFVQENPGSVVIIDCLEYLMLYNDFKSVFKFLSALKDYVVIQHGSGLIVFVDEEVLSNQERALLLKEFEPL
ncbi:hypothetical membrane protein, conserved, containing DUF835 family [Thermococcus kodakarensis KOD1]|uniref:Hypothetical membrane protein, conserved, containing DUF835 family n=1 Tax=Thermococcus kodakarensis (strain ATCC BAA-918 / JCM 12380 / KOD1) TaxID=69014 RepID=Q5JEW4_THEKO|nr:DUF835 domain-containing protein [Thermococcus kodakarensis]WCN27975.1 DUF835 domain-containing protein [Thermococcus kodakarensis]WCN30274.1 DUF835 domain-containing protein [Thermococcus kodakarensis]BAD86314.1 hypothetical membrane protein, conserved, containing DUF835 family [Thermococcus kodakarensis KOD1]